MRIAQVAPLYESVPPKLYGGTERIVSYLTEELVRQGHDVTLFATGDSETAAELVSACPAGMRLGGYNPAVYHLLMLEQVMEQRERFDVVHFHIDFSHFPLVRRYGIPHVTTVHGRIDLPDLVPLFSAFPQMPLVSISNDQRMPLPWLNWIDTVYHGLPRDLFALNEHPDEYLAFIGRISPEKGPDRAIEIARRAGMKLRIAAKVDRDDEAYFESVVEPLLNQPHVEFIGEVGGREKEAFIANARGLLFPIDWPEPFGLVMTESMACGTPIVAFRCGSVPEVMKDGVSGFVVDSIDDAVDAVRRLDQIDRRSCRNYFDERFAVEHMANHYVEVYQRIVESSLKRRRMQTIRRRRRWSNLKSAPRPTSQNDRPTEPLAA